MSKDRVWRTFTTDSGVAGLDGASVSGGRQLRLATVTRRRFLGASGATVVGLAGGALGGPSLMRSRGSWAEAEIGPATGSDRSDAAFQVREDAAKLGRDLGVPPHPDNGDEDLYLDRIGSYSKALPHNDLGEVHPDAYSAMILALSTGDAAAYEAIPLGGSRKLANPQASLAFELWGPDSHALTMPPASTFNSARTAAEMAEVYWQALTRDVPFARYDRDRVIRQAADDLSRFTDFAGPKEGGHVTPGTLFRGEAAGDLTGPYISQFLWKPIPYGAQTVEQRIKTTVRGDDYMTRYEEWLAVQRGASTGSNKFDSTARYIRNGRDLGEWVHWDFPFEAFLNACLILLGMQAPVDEANPYRGLTRQGSFITFGTAHVLDMLARAASAALKVAWYQKWHVHRRLRPEVFAGRVHNHLTGARTYPIHEEMFSSAAPGEVLRKFGTYMLPSAYPEGSPTHPAYPAGHATIAGACATVLKAFFDESFSLANPVVSSEDGLSLQSFSGPTLTVGNELNKLASNVAIGRDTAGVHWRADGVEGLKLGEEVAIRLLKEASLTYHEQFAGFSLTKLDGTTIAV